MLSRDELNYCLELSSGVNLALVPSNSKLWNLMVSSESSVMVSSMSVVWRLLIFIANKLLSHSLTFSYLLKNNV